MILLAHFTTFEAPQPLRHPELARRVPERRLPAVIGLPFFSRGMGVGELGFRTLVGSVLPRP